jgi:hypothetical protein
VGGSVCFGKNGRFRSSHKDSFLGNGIGNELELEAITFVGPTVFLELATFTPDLR